MNKKVRSWKPMKSMDLDIAIFMKNLLTRKHMNIKDAGGFATFMRAKIFLTCLLWRRVKN